VAARRESTLLLEKPDKSFEPWWRKEDPDSLPEGRIIVRAAGLVETDAVGTAVGQIAAGTEEKNMASAQQWLEVIAWVKTLFEATKATIDLRGTYEKYRLDHATIRESQRVAAAFTTYSDAEVESLLHRLKGCRDRFIDQGGGKERAQCICSVLQEAEDGNGGTLPDIDDWDNIYKALQCETKSQTSR